MPGGKELDDAFLSFMAGLTDQAMSELRSVTKGNEFLTELIAQHDGDKVKATQQRAKFGLMREEGADPPPNYSEGDLCAAAQTGDLGKTAALLAAGLNPNAAAELLGG